MAKIFTSAAPRRARKTIALRGVLGLLALAVLLGTGHALWATASDTAASRGEPLPVSAAALRPLAPEAWLGMGSLGTRRLERLVGRIEGANEHCMRAGTRDRRSRAKDRLTRLFELLSKSATARGLIDTAWRRNVVVCSDGKTNLLAYYVAGLRLVGVNSRLTEAQQVVFLAHELSHIPQHPVYSDDRRFSASDLILLRRAREAAAEALATCILWELRETGYSEAWNTKRLDNFYGDIAQNFSAARGSGGDILAAMRAAYNQWFAKKARRRLYDGMTVEHLARISEDAVGLVSPVRVLDHDFLREIGSTSRGNYLATRSGRLLTDVYYTGGLSFDHTAQVESLLTQATGQSRPAVSDPTLSWIREAAGTRESWSAHRPAPGHQRRQ